MVAGNPCITSLQSVAVIIKQAPPELVKLQPTGVYRDVLNSNDKVHREFIRELGALVAAPVETDGFKTTARSMTIRTANLLVDDTSAC